MNKQTIIAKIKEHIAAMGWKMFLWANGFTEEYYWNQIYEQELSFRNRKPVEED